MLALLGKSLPPATDHWLGGGATRLGDAAGVLGLVGAVVAVIFGLGYAYGAPLLYGGPAIPIAVTATLGGLVLAAGVVAAAGPDHWPLRALAGDSTRARLLRAFVPLTMVVALTISIAEHRLADLEAVGHVLVGSLLTVIFALGAGLVVSRVAQAIGGTIDQARLARQKAEDALRESRDDLNHAQAVAHTGSWRLDVRRNELLWSDETYRVFGVPKGTSLTYETFLATVHPEDRDFVDTSWKAALGGAHYDIEHRIIVGDATRWIRERAVLEFDQQGVLLGGFGTAQDITERKQAEQERERLLAEMARQARLLDAILENTPSRLAYLGRDLRYIRVNAAYAANARMAPEEFVGRHRLELFPNAPEVAAMYQRVLDTGEPATIAEYTGTPRYRPEVGTRCVRIDAAPVKNERGEVEGLVTSMVDITDQVQTRQQLLEAERLRAQMAETVALEINHRMKNNLMLVSGILELQLSAQPAASDAAAALRQARARISALSTVHEQMYEQRSGRVELGDVVRRIAEISVGTLATEDVALSVNADSVLISSRAATTLAVVSNELITNALKHGAPGPDGRRRVDVALSHQEGKLRLRVWSSGNPVPAGFDVGKQKGLGLHLCRELVGGELRGAFSLWADEGGTASEVVLDDQSLDR